MQCQCQWQSTNVKQQCHEMILNVNDMQTAAIRIILKMFQFVHFTRPGAGAVLAVLEVIIFTQFGHFTPNWHHHHHCSSLRNPPLCYVLLRCAVLYTSLLHTTLI